MAPLDWRTPRGHDQGYLIGDLARGGAVPARDVAGRACRRYPSPSALRFVLVGFVDQSRRLLVFPEHRIRDSFQFAVGDLDPQAPRLSEGWTYCGVGCAR